MRTCQYYDGEPCINLAEGNTDYCGTHNRLIRKQQSDEQKAAEKFQNSLKKAKLKQQQPRPKPKAVSDKQSKRMAEYMKIRDKFLNGRWCAYHGHGCIPTEVHHGAGKIGDLLTDTRYFVAVCPEAHRMIEGRPKWAKENGYSFDRTNK